MTRAVISSGPIGGNEPVVHIDMSTDLDGILMPSPVLTASGCAAAGRELDQFFDITRIGAVVTKSVMLQPRSGRATPRMAETPSGMLNSIGLQGPGIDVFLEKDLAWLTDRGARTIVSIAGGTVDEYAKLAARLRVSEGVAGIEVNISCPNVENRGQVFACDPDMAASVIQAVKRHSDPRTPIFAKLSPDVTDIVAVAGSVVRAGATGVSVINTMLGMVINPDTMRPHLAGHPTGGGAVRVADPAGVPRSPHHRDGRHPHRPGCPRVHPRGRQCRLGGHRRLPRPVLAHAHPRGARAGPRRAGLPEPGGGGLVRPPPAGSGLRGGRP
jgi:dihydroorotate dehydrogenase (NAD+) catalytic subunit